MDQDPSAFSRDVRLRGKRWMNGRQARVKCSRSGRQPDQQQRSVGLAPPPSLLHDSPVSSMEGRGQCDPPFSPPLPSTLLWELYRATRGSSPRPKPFSPPLPPTPATLGRAGVTCARPSRLPSARSKLLRACHGTTPAQPTLQQRAPTGPLAHRYKDPRAPRTRTPRLELGRGRGTERLPRGSLLHLIPGRLATHPPCGSGHPLEPVLRRSILKTQTPHTLPRTPITLHLADHLTDPQEAPCRPSPIPLPLLSGPHQNVCATRRLGQPPGRPQLPAERSGPRRGGGGSKR